MNIDELLSASNDFTAYVKACKAALKLAIEGKGVAVGEYDLLSTYANKVASITGGGSETIFTVTFFDYDGITVLKTQDVLQGGDVNPPSDPTREAYTFSGWSASSFNVQADLTILAQYTYSPNMVALLDYDLSLIELQNVATGADIAAETPSKANMTFTGWSDSLLNVQGNRALIAEYDTDPTTAAYFDLLLTEETGLTLTFYMYVPNSNNISTIYYGDGGSNQIGYISYIQATHTYPSYGSYRVRITTPINGTVVNSCGWSGNMATEYQKGLLTGNHAKAIIRAYEGSTTRFGGWCFKDCINLQSVKLYNNGPNIGPCLFNNCSSLTGVVIPDTVVTTYGDSPLQKIFEGCTSLERLVFLGPVPTFWSLAMSNIPMSCVIYVPDSYVSDYQSALIAYGYTIQGISTLPNSYEL